MTAFAPELAENRRINVRIDADINHGRSEWLACRRASAHQVNA